jgi:primosomal protein N' (replication factor Y)
MKVPILLPNIFNHPFTYKSDISLKTGDYVIVPFGKTKLTGVVWDHFETNNKKNFQTKNVVRKLKTEPLSTNTINFLNWFSEYNLIPKGMALKLHLISNEAVENLPEKEFQIYKFYKKINNFKLSEEQKKSFIELKVKNNRFRVHVLQGTTGSGKTIVYFNSIKDRLDKGFQGLILLPEIGLTSEFEKKFVEFFGFTPAIWHSGISKKKKKIIWNGLSKGNIKVVIGARSALFLPFKNLGIIIVDEEHDQSYKQDEGVIYNARDMAISRASFENIPINLITAVPSIETYENMIKKKYTFSRIISRYKNAQLPKHEIIDLNKYNLKSQSWISPKTIEKVNSHLQNGDQVLFFINRRGFSPYVFCKNCLKVYTCPHCSINLVYHKNKKNLLCHYCGFKTILKRSCDRNISGSCKFTFSGPGVERISEEIKTFFPKYNSLIFSSDTMNKKSSLSDLQKITNNEVQILIGTQLISKGYHFPNLNCIVVLDADLTSSGHDLRGAEKNLQLYHQLSGRAGRTGNPAIVYFQTYNLRSDIISKITNSDPFIFLENELKIRKKNNLPPFERFISLILTSKDEKKLDFESYRLKQHLVNNISGKILGPINAPIYKIRKKFRNRFLIRAKKSAKIQESLSSTLKKFEFSPGMKLSVDVDPISFN